MAGEKQNNICSPTNFHFSVKIPALDSMVAFQEISGLATDTTAIEYRAGNSKSFNVIKMPGPIKSSNVTLKKGIFVKDNAFWTWYSRIQYNVIKRETVTIQLLDEGSSPTMVWTMTNAWPTKITGADLKAEGSEVAVETLEFAYEVLTVAHG